METPKIDPRDARQIYDAALILAKDNCPEWNPGDSQSFGPGRVLLKLFARLAEIFIRQLNRIPEKYQLAFYDFIGLDYLPPAAGKAPLTFQLAEGAQTALVPARAKAASAIDSTVVFETIEPLTMAKIKIGAAYSMNPWEDQYTDHSREVNGSQNGFRIFGGDPAQKSVEHLLYLADDAFDLKTPADLTVKFHYQNAPAGITDYLAKAGDGAGKLLKTSVRSNESQRMVMAQFSKVTIPKTMVNGSERNWISFQPAVALPPNGDAVPPIIDQITASLTVDGIQPEGALFNNSPVDPKKGFYPFGQMPKRGDAFYLGAEEAFSKKGALITIKSIAPVFLMRLALSGSLAALKGIQYEASRQQLIINQPLSLQKSDLLKLSTDSAFQRAVEALFQKQDTQLSWEYWNGSNWADIPGAKDTTRNFAATGTITFPCPEITPVALNGLLSRWIRVRIEDSSGYGAPGYYQELKAIGYTYVPDTFQPPFIQSLTVKFELPNLHPRWIMRKSQFEYQTIKPGKAFQPFMPLAEERPLLYLGLEGDGANQPLSLYFSRQAKTYSELAPVIHEPGYGNNAKVTDKVRTFAWKYFNGSQWVNLAVGDETGGFAKNGLVRLILPADIARANFFGRTNLYWLKVEAGPGQWLEPPRLKGIFPNTVWAEHTKLITDELLGSSNGEAEQTFPFVAKPLLGGAIIEIRETETPGADELEQLSIQADALRFLKNDFGDITEVWVRWDEVPSFDESGPASRHYRIDRVAGRVLFGDGVNGMIPPALPDNIRARQYLSGGGVKGYQIAGVLRGLKTTIPNLEGVTNHDPASGGRDGETMAGLLQRVPHYLKCGGRAVTTEDFEWLAREATAEVSRAKCIRSANGTLQVIIVPGYEKDQPTPESSLADEVKAYLQERAFAPIAPSIEVVGPVYQVIDVETTIIPRSLAEGALVAVRVEQRLRVFLDPVRGGPDGTGWDFGRDLFLSEVAAVIEDVAGVDYLVDLKLKKGPAFLQDRVMKMRLAIAENELPCPGNINVKLTGGKTDADSIA